MKKNNDNNVGVHGGSNGAHITTRDISYFLPHFTPNIRNQTFLGSYFISGASTQLSIIERFVSVKPVDTQFNWFFHLGVTSGNDILF